HEKSDDRREEHTERSPEEPLAQLNQVLPERHGAFRVAAPRLTGSHGRYDLELGSEPSVAAESSLLSAESLFISLLKIFIDWPTLLASAGSFVAPKSN